MTKIKEFKEKDSVNWELDEIMSDRFGRYSKYIIQERALPDARDGLKPVQRRILYAMYHDGNTCDKPHRKSAKTVGLVIGTYHPHGDSSVYEALVRMSQDWKNNLPLIDMHGNNGSLDDDPPAAMRYTEARLAKFAHYLLTDIEKGTVSFTNNYDDSEMEPTVLPTAFPSLLINGSTGIASGYATNIPPHNFGEILDACIFRLNNPTSTLDDLLDIVKGPDFPTGGIIQGKEEIKKVFSSGKGRILIRSLTRIEQKKNLQQLIISEIPFEVVKCDLVKKIDAIRLNKELDTILDVRDESGRDGIRIVVDIKKDADAQLVLNYLLKNTDLQINYNYNMIAIENHRPVLLNLLSAIDVFISFRKEVVLNRSTYLLNQKLRRMHLLEGLIKAISILDDVMEIIRSSIDKEDSKKRLKEGFLFSDEQAEAIVMMRLYRLSNTDITQLKEEYTLLIKESGILKDIINSPLILKNVIINELKDLKNAYPTPRRSKIESKIEEIVIKEEEIINNEKVYFSITEDGYIRRYSERVYLSNNSTLPALKDGDKLLGLQEAETLDILLIFTDRGNYLYLPLYKVEETKWKDIGKHISSYIKTEAGQKVVSVIVVKNFENNAYLMSLSAKGYLKKTPVIAYQVSRFSKELTAMKLDSDDYLVRVDVIRSGEQILLASENGYYTRYSSDVINCSSTVATKGVKGMSLKDDDKVIDFVSFNENKDLLLLTNDLQAKRLHLADLELTSRNARGYRLFKQRKKEPYKLAYLAICDASTYFTIIDNNLKYSLFAKDISLIGQEGTFGKKLDFSNDFYFQKAPKPFREINYEAVKKETKKDDEEYKLLVDE